MVDVVNVGLGIASKHWACWYETDVDDVHTSYACMS
jgi:hypothetical protein